MTSESLADYVESKIVLAEQRCQVQQVWSVECRMKGK